MSDLPAYVGATYQGEMKDGKFHGRGTYTFANGLVFEGEFRDGCFHGPGRMRTAEGTYSCVWEHGREVAPRVPERDGTPAVDSARSTSRTTEQADSNAQNAAPTTTFVFADGLAVSSPWPYLTAETSRVEADGTRAQAAGDRRFFSEITSGRIRPGADVAIADGQ